MKFGTMIFVCAIFILNVFARKRKFHELYDVQQFDSLDLSNHKEIQNFTSNTDDQYVNGVYPVALTDSGCYNENGFNPFHKGVSQIRVTFPTESLTKAWGNNNYFIGFGVNCQAGNSNSNWYKFYQTGVKFDNTKKYTSFSMDVGKCRRPFLYKDEKKWTGYDSKDHISRTILGMQINFKKNGVKSDTIVIGPKTPGDFRRSSTMFAPKCPYYNNFVPLYISNIP